ncbi:MAG: penicillin-binding protein 2 [Hyphomicrobiaceae bacterium]|nr:penicillin-binding protein 2 [Hyphomicrobiaceae bacterium]
MLKTPVLKESPQRLTLVFMVFALVFLVLAGRLVQLGLRHHDDLRLKASARTNQAIARPEIHDRFGRVLAMDVPTSSLYADPKILLGVDETVEKLAVVLPSIDPEKLRNKLFTKRRFVWIKRFLTPDQRRAVYDLGLPGLYFLREPKRFYPLGAQSAHLVGTVDRDNKGLSGIERHIDQLMRDERDGPGSNSDQKRPLVLSVDMRVQNGVVHELQKAILRYQAKAGVGIVLDIKTGEVLALSSLPSFDPLKPGEALQPDRINRAMRGVYELGSVLKTFTIAMGLDEGAVVEGQRLDVATPVKLGKFVIKDHHKTRDGTMSVREIFTHSSNVGAARIARKVGVDGHRAFLSRLQLLGRLRSEAGNAGLPLQPAKWHLADSLSVAYGYRLSVSPLQLASSAMALFNGGNLVRPTFLRRDKSEALKLGTPVLQSSTSRFMRTVMRENVISGTGRAANIKGYRIGGKTGTARKAAKGGYGKQLITSFIGIFPSESPRYLTYVMLDEPKKVKATRGQNSASSNAAPLTGAIILRVAPLLGVNPQLPSTNSAN